MSAGFSLSLIVIVCAGGLVLFGLFAALAIFLRKDN